jgi:hypothetical protein
VRKKRRGGKKIKRENVRRRVRSAYYIKGFQNKYRGNTLKGRGK